MVGTTAALTQLKSTPTSIQARQLPPYHPSCRSFIVGGRDGASHRRRMGWPLPWPECKHPSLHHGSGRMDAVPSPSFPRWQSVMALREAASSYEDSCSRGSPKENNVAVSVAKYWVVSEKVMPLFLSQHSIALIHFCLNTQCIHSAPCSIQSWLHTVASISV